MKQRMIPETMNYSIDFIRKRSLKGLTHAIKLLGGHNKFIKKLNLSDSKLEAWKKSKYGVDPRYVLTIERLTNGEVHRNDLRIDIFSLEG